ncbi:hypothetical protein [Pseudonocardia sp.]|jgi:hypothetical protein|uniref:hypothetical protein n=1 Tax=Pseudonocardia sp. TaxID=60912 RepID=UPI0031FCD5D9
MDKRVETGREFWRAVLLAGGATAIPRWTLDPAPGVAEHAATLDDDLAAALRRLADGLALPLHSVWPRTRRCNRAVSLEDIAEHPVLADLTELPHREHAPNC